MLKSNGALSTEEREEEMKQMEVYRSHSKFMKNKVEPAAHGNYNCFVTVLFLTCAGHVLFKHRFIVYDSLLGLNTSRRHVVFLIFTLTLVLWYGVYHS